MKFSEGEEPFLAKKKRPPGRPSKYKPEYCEMLLDHCAKGLSFAAFAGLIGVNIDTISEWAKVHDEFSVAKKDGLAKSRLFWEEMGIDAANGKIEHFKAVPWVMTMKNCHGYRDKTEVVTRDENKNPEDMSEDELDERIAHALKVVEKHGSAASKSDTKRKTKKTAKKKTVKKSKRKSD